MKIRNGFVSNSSSSSYVIAYTELDKCPHCGRTDIDVVSMIRDGDDYGDTYISLEGYDEVLEELESWVDDSDIDDIKKEMDKLKAKNYKFALTHISYNSEVLIELLQKSKSVKILYGDGD